MHALFASEIRMTYCVGILVDEGLVFLSDSRTNAGVDQISTFRKVALFEHPGQIAGELPRLFNIYSAGNFIEATPDTPYFQSGESKYGKPILDRVITRSLGLQRSVKCALVSMDSTIRSNLSVGLPLDLITVKRDALRIGSHVNIDAQHQYYTMINRQWSESLRHAFHAIPDPDWL